MGQIEDTLAQLGETLPDAPVPAANYVPYLKVGDMLYVSGQVSQGPDGLMTGTLGGPGDIEVGRAAAKACALSLLAQVRAATGGDLDKLAQVVKLTGFVSSAPGFTDQPKVINGASDFLVEVLGDVGRHTRSAVGVSALPMGAMVEIEGIFRLS